MDIQANQSVNANENDKLALVKKAIRHVVTLRTYQAYVAPARVIAIEGDQLVVVVPSVDARDWLNRIAAQVGRIAVEVGVAQIKWIVR